MSEPLADYALLSDCRSGGLVHRSGRIDWLCFPRFDAPSVFGRLLDEQAGHWMLGPVDTKESTRRYQDSSLVLETEHRTTGGRVRVTDALAVGPNEEGHELAKEVPHALLRSVEGLEGEVELEFELAARPEYGIVEPLLEPVAGGIIAHGGANILVLSSPLDLEITDSRARTRFRVKKGDRVDFALQHGHTTNDKPEVWPARKIRDRLQQTTHAWQSWADEHQAYDGPWRELVALSGCVLQGLTYQPTGAMVAAPTTSLPEDVGGARNWDYRYCWVRDSSVTLNALWVAACPDEAEGFFEFLTHAALTPVRTGKGLSVMFGVAGEHDLTERTLDHLNGWNDSRPVRIGNDAWKQNQLDVHGELLDAALRLRDQLEKIPKTTRSFLASVADGAAERWMEPDHGLWEIRGDPAHYVYSKVMCWVALDRAIRLADLLDAADRVDVWKATRDDIREAILARGWSDRLGSFTQTFDNEELDASCLIIPIVGFLPADDPRVRGTVRAIQEGLMDEQGLLLRYRTADGLPGREGNFLLCTFWLAEAKARAGEITAARKTFDAAARHANDLGLFSEEVDRDGALIGNFPQAYSHVGLVNAAWAIHEEEQGRKEQRKEPEVAP